MAATDNGDSLSTTTDVAGTTDEERKLYVQIWEKAVDNQMHLNEMSVKSRQLGMTFVAAALGVGVVLISRGSDFALPFEILGCAVLLHVSALIVDRNSVV